MIVMSFDKCKNHCEINHINRNFTKTETYMRKKNFLV